MVVEHKHPLEGLVIKLVEAHVGLCEAWGIERESRYLSEIVECSLSAVSIWSLGVASVASALEDAEV